jgi:predicted RNA-binding Zn-ribbon protein involved in translation (DUF1610 family)
MIRKIIKWTLGIQVDYSINEYLKYYHKATGIPAKDAELFDCPKCGVKAGKRCVTCNGSGKYAKWSHRYRVDSVFTDIAMRKVYENRFHIIYALLIKR